MPIYLLRSSNSSTTRPLDCRFRNELTRFVIGSSTPLSLSIGLLEALSVTVTRKLPLPTSACRGYKYIARVWSPVSCSCSLVMTGQQLYWWADWIPNELNHYPLIRRCEGHGLRLVLELWVRPRVKVMASCWVTVRVTVSVIDWVRVMVNGSDPDSVR